MSMQNNQSARHYSAAVPPRTNRTAQTGYMFASVLLMVLMLAWVSGNAYGRELALEDISYSTLPGDKVQITLKLSGPAPTPGSFTTDNPARIAIDLPGTQLALARKSQQIGIGVARGVRAVAAGGRTRVVLSLARMVPYDIRTQDNLIYVNLDSSLVEPPPATATAGGEGQEAAPIGNRIENIDFRRGKQGRARIIVSLSDPRTVIDMQEKGGRLVIDFLNSQLPEKLERRLDVTDFATPVTTIDAYNRDRSVRLVITPTGDYEHLAYQTGDTYTVEVKPLTKAEAEEAKKDELGYSGEKLSLNFQNIEVRAVLQLIADFTGLNIIASDTVQGSITLRLKNVPWDQALDIILKTKGLAMRRTGNVMLIAPGEEIAAREKVELEARQQMEELVPLRTEFIQVNYAKAADIANLLKAETNSLLSKRGNVTVDERTNTLMVLDTDQKLEEIRGVITQLDIPVRQVLIESRVVVANDDFSRSLGVRFGATGVAKNGSDGIIGATGNVSGTDTMVNSAISNIGSTGQPYPVTMPSASDRLNVDLGVAGPAGQFALAILGSDYLVDLELSALQQEGRGEVISNPRVLTSNQKEALIEQGVEIPYLQATSSGATSVAFKKAVLSLSVTPQITPDDRVIMDLRVSKDSVGEIFAGVPSINTREVNTQVLVDNGDTVVLGGVYEQTQSDEVDKVPFLGDLPVLGALFRQTRKVDDKAELLIFVTPKIVKQGLEARLD